MTDDMRAKARPKMYPALRLNTVIRLPDARVGTICWNHLDGSGGVWGEHTFQMPDGGFGDELPAPEFMLRKAEIGKIRTFRATHPTAECVGIDFEVLQEAEDGE